jgi:hypothetical protein
MNLDFIILGAQKAGSSYLHSCLSEHPSVLMPPEESTIFESPDYERGGLSEFERRFATCGSATLGIKRPSYLARPEIPSRIQAYTPEAKLIVSLRNPVDRAVSAYFHYVRNRFLPMLGIEEGMRRILDGIRDEAHPASNDILEYGLYASHLKRYLALFPRSQVLILLHEELTGNALGTIQSIYLFLGLDPTYVPRALHDHPQEVLYDPLRLRIARWAHGLKFIQSEANSRIAERPHGSATKFLFRASERVDQTLAKVRGNRKPVLSAELRLRLVEYYRSDIDELERLLGRDLGKWKVSTPQVPH